MTREEFIAKNKRRYQQKTFENLMEARRENQRLNNVLNELEKWVYQFREEHKNDTGIFDKFLTTKEVLDKIHELKESDK